MEKKIQYKFQVPNSFADNLKSKGIEFNQPSEHIYVYFRAPNINNNFFVVLRLKESRGIQKLDMKIRNNETGEWSHFESGVSDRRQVQAIFEQLGCEPISTFHKKRRTWQNEFLRFDFDEIKELGNFLEVKFDLRNKIKAEQFLRNIGVNSKKQDRRSIIEIYLEKFKAS